MKLSSAERETILRFDEESSMAELYSYNEKLKKRIHQLALKYPDLFIQTQNSTGAVTVQIPKSLISIILREPMSEAERQIRRERAKEHGYQPKNSALSPILPEASPTFRDDSGAEG